MEYQFLVNLQRQMMEGMRGSRGLIGWSIQLWNSTLKFNIFESSFSHNWGWLNTLILGTLSSYFCWGWLNTMILEASNSCFFMGRLGVFLDIV